MRRTKPGVTVTVVLTVTYSLIVIGCKLLFGWLDAYSWLEVFAFLFTSIVSGICVLVLVRRLNSVLLPHDLYKMLYDQTISKREVEKLFDAIAVKLDTEKSPCCHTSFELDLEGQTESIRTYKMCCMGCGNAFRRLSIRLNAEVDARMM